MHDSDTWPRRAATLEVDVAGLTRVEGEGSLRLRVRDGAVVEAQLAIFEAPRYFEQLVVGPDAGRGHRHRGAHLRDLPGRLPDDRGPCLRGRSSGVEIDPAVRALRRLLYCGEWIESHALHVYLLHAPDFLGYPSAWSMAARPPRRRSSAACALKRTGNRIVSSSLGGRPIHPV